MRDVPTIGIDVGATKVTAALVTDEGDTLERADRHLTPSSATAGLVPTLADMVGLLRKIEPDARAVGVGAAGLVTWPEGEIEFAVNHDHRRLKLGDRLTEETGLPVTVENDANAAAWAEARRHPGEGVLFLSVGTGLGSGFVADGELIRGHQGRGAEIGHLVVDRDSNERCGCGRRGCLELVASGRALESAGRRIVRADPCGALARRVRSASPSMSVMIDAARDGDPDARAAVRTMGAHLGRAVADVMSLLPVDRVLVGGGLAALRRDLLDPLRTACDKDLGRSKYLCAPRIGLATRGPDAILIGAALLAARRVPSHQAAALTPV